MNRGNAGKGRKRGSKNKVTEDMRRIWTEAFHRVKYSPDAKAGVDSLVKWGSDYPTEFYKLAARLIPSEAKHELSGKVGVVVLPSVNDRDR